MAVPHSLVRIHRSMINKPHLIEPTSFNSLLSYVQERIKGQASVTPEATPEMFLGGKEGGFESQYVDALKLGSMDISGPLTYRTSGWEAMCGGTSYEMLKDQMEYFVSKGAKTVAMFVDSGGGEAHGMIDSANYLRKLADENGIKIIAFVDGMSASAAYGISSIADEIVMTSDSQVGSIGVLIQLYNDSKYLEKIGYERTFVTAGADKVPYDKEGAFTESFIAGLQEQVDELYEAFTGHVASARGIGLDVVKGTEANVFMSKDAIKLGLADKVMTAEEFNDYLGGYADANKGKEVNPLKKALNMNSNKEETQMTDKTAELTDLLAKATAKLETQGVQMTEASAAVATLTAQLEGMKAELDAAKVAMAEMETQKATAALASRKAALAEVLPADQVDAKLASYGSLDEATFSFIVGELQAAKDARAASFAAIGQDGSDEVEHDDAQEAAQPATPHAALLATSLAAARALQR